MNLDRNEIRCMTTLFFKEMNMTKEGLEERLGSYLRKMDNIQKQNTKSNKLRKRLRQRIVFITFEIKIGTLNQECVLMQGHTKGSYNGRKMSSSYHSRHLNTSQKIRCSKVR